MADERPCPICPDELGINTMVEPDVDGDVLFYECPECDYAFGHRKIEAVSSSECAIGVPESVRRAGSIGGAPIEKAPSTQVNLGMSIGRRVGL